MADTVGRQPAASTPSVRDWSLPPRLSGEAALVQGFLFTQEEVYPGFHGTGYADVPFVMVGVESIATIRTSSQVGVVGIVAHGSARLARLHGTGTLAFPGGAAVGPHLHGLGTLSLSGTDVVAVSWDSTFPGMRQYARAVVRGPGYGFHTTVLHTLATGFAKGTGVTTYSTQFNSMAVRGRDVYAANDSGIFRRGGALDHTTPITTRVVRQGHDMGSEMRKRFDAAHLRISCPNGYSLKLMADGAEATVSAIDRISSRVHGSKIALPRGLSGRELGFIFEATGQVILEDIRFVIDTSTERRGRQTGA